MNLRPSQNIDCNSSHGFYSYLLLVFGKILSFFNYIIEKKERISKIHLGLISFIEEFYFSVTTVNSDHNQHRHALLNAIFIAWHY